MTRRESRKGCRSHSAGPRRWTPVVAAIAATALLVVAGSLAAAESPPSSDADAQIAALNEKYAALPATSDPETLLERGWSYEKEFSQIGGEAPNGKTSLTPQDYQDHAVPDGIQDINEGVPGYELTNKWSGSVNGEAVVVVAGTQIGEPDQGGVVVFNNSGQSPFVPTPKAVGKVTIVSASDSSLTLASENGAEFVFDLASLEFVI